MLPILVRFIDIDNNWLLVGAGIGRYTEWFHEQNARSVLALDFVKEFIEENERIVQQRWGEAGVKKVSTCSYKSLLFIHHILTSNSPPVKILMHGCNKTRHRDRRCVLGFGIQQLAADVFHRRGYQAVRSACSPMVARGRMPLLSRKLSCNSLRLSP